MCTRRQNSANLPCARRSTGRNCGAPGRPRWLGDPRGESVPAARVSCPWDLIAFGREMVSFTEFATVLLPATSREQKSLERCVRFKIVWEKFTLVRGHYSPARRMARCANVLLWNEQREMELTASKRQVQPYIDAMLENAKNLDQVTPALLLGADERARLRVNCAGAARVRGAERQ
jgi:hypothetical protein